MSFECPIVGGPCPQGQLLEETFTTILPCNYSGEIPSPELDGAKLRSKLALHTQLAQERGCEGMTEEQTCPVADADRAETRLELRQRVTGFILRLSRS